MNEFFKEYVCKLEKAINELENANNCWIEQLEQIILLIVTCISEIKEYMLKEGFKGIEEEMYFFKYQKPSIVAKLIYYNTIYKLETKKPYGEKSTTKYLKKELKKLNKFFDNNIDFYKYYRSNHSFLDGKMFVRGEHDIKLWLDTHYFQFDHSFSTSHDYKPKLRIRDI